ncbi:MAG: gliding motility-associated C-terminal domain-containing protein [Bacteroidota bacterium]
MCQKSSLFLIFLLLALVETLAQPQPCEDPPTMTSICDDACIICDIDGFEGRHDSSQSGVGPPGFCTVVQHNMQWIAFIAGSEDLKVQLSVSDCVQGFGLEIGIYEGINCQNFQLVSQCWGAAQAVAENTSKTFENTVPLVIGQYYYIVMDGAFGDNCDWKLDVLEGSTQVDPLDTSGELLGDDTVCPEQLIPFSVNAPTGATEFDWTVNGVPVNISNNTIDYSFPTDGNYSVCVIAKNACNEAPPTCRVIQVTSVPDTEIIDVLCEGNTYEVADTILSEGGLYEFVLENVEGCDSLVIVDLEELATPMLDVDVDICEGDTLFIGNTPYTQTGIFQETLTSVFDCDSIVNLDLFVIVCNITSTDTPTPPICFGESSGAIDFSVVNGTPPFTYSWADLNNLLSGAGNISNVGAIITIEDLPKGTYLITIEDTFGNSDIIVSEVTEPSEMNVGFVASDFNGVNVSCADSDDGNLEATASGGVPGYSFLWSTNQSSSAINNLSAGIYQVTITDQSGCTLVGNYEMIVPATLEVFADFNDPVCDGPNSGFIEVLQSSGGIAPYSYSLDNNIFTDDEIFENLTEGIYEISVMDANGCVATISEILEAPQIPTVDLGENATVDLGTPYTFQTAINNVNLLEVIWTPADGFDCESCLNPNFVPLNTGTYTLIVASEDGCVDTDSILITVNKFRKFFAPNAFSPNFDGYNDYFTLFGGTEVAMIQKLTVFNRWGAVVFEGKEMNPGIETEGWDGRLNGKGVNPDVYVWMADLRFIDGEVISYSGDVTVVK